MATRGTPIPAGTVKLIKSSTLSDREAARAARVSTYTVWKYRAGEKKPKVS